MPGRFPVGVSDSSRPFWSATGPQGEAGISALYVIPSNPNVMIPVDNAGANPSYTLNFSYLYIYKAGVIQTGWIIDSVVEYGCSHTEELVSGSLFVRITSVLANTGYIQFTLTKSGEETLTAIVSYTKLYEGPTGIQGAQGNTGSTGAAGVKGDTGNDGTGLVVVKKTIEVKEPPLVTVANVSGSYRLTFPSAHGLEVDEPILVFEIDSAHDSYGIVTNIISTTIVDTTCLYRDASFKNVRQMRHFCQGDLFNRFNGTVAQTIDFSGIFPVGAKLVEMHLVRTVNGGTMLAYAGKVSNPDVGWNLYLNGEMSTNVDDVNTAILSTHSDELIVSSSDTKRDLYLHGIPYYVDWETDLIDAEWELHASYINYTL